MYEVSSDLKQVMASLQKLTFKDEVKQKKQVVSKQVNNSNLTYIKQEFELTRTLGRELVIFLKIRLDSTRNEIQRNHLLGNKISQSQIKKNNK